MSIYQIVKTSATSNPSFDDLIILQNEINSMNLSAGGSISGSLTVSGTLQTNNLTVLNSVQSNDLILSLGQNPTANVSNVLTGLTSSFCTILGNPATTLYPGLLFNTADQTHYFVNHTSQPSPTSDPTTLILSGIKCGGLNSLGSTFINTSGGFGTTIGNSGSTTTIAGPISCGNVSSNGNFSCFGLATGAGSVTFGNDITLGNGKLFNLGVTGSERLLWGSAIQLGRSGGTDLIITGSATGDFVIRNQGGRLAFGSANSIGLLIDTSNNSFINGDATIAVFKVLNFADANCQITRPSAGTTFSDSVANSLCIRGYDAILLGNAHNSTVTSAIKIDASNNTFINGGLSMAGGKPISFYGTGTNTAAISHIQGSGVIAGDAADDFVILNNTSGKSVHIGNGTSALNVAGVVINGSNNVALNGDVAISKMLSMANLSDNKRLVIWDGNTAESRTTGTTFYGLGANGNALRYQVAASTDLHRFYCSTTEIANFGNSQISLNGDATLASSKRLITNSVATAGQPITAMEIMSFRSNTAATHLKLRANYTTAGTAASTDQIEFMTGSNASILTLFGDQSATFGGNATITNSSTTSSLATAVTGSSSTRTLFSASTATAASYNYQMDFSTYNVGASDPCARIKFLDSNFSNNIVFQTKTPGASTNTLADRLTIANNGDITSTGMVTCSKNLYMNSQTNVKMINLYDPTNPNQNDQTRHDYFGFGVSANTLRYHVSASTVDHVFFAATSSSASTELLRIGGNGTTLLTGNLNITGNLGVTGSYAPSGDLIIATNKNLNFTGGTSGLDMSAATGIFKSPSGGMNIKPIQTVIVSGGSTTTVTFSSIPSNFNHLQVKIYGQVIGSSANSFDMRVNGIVTGLYDFYSEFSSGAPVTSSAVTLMVVGSLSPNTGSYASYTVIDFPFYSNTNFGKVVRARTTSGTASNYMQTMDGNVNTTAAISSLTFMFSGAGFFANNSIFNLYVW